MNFETLRRLRDNHIGLRLLRADLLPFFASFFWRAFVAANRRQLDEDALVAALEDHLFALQESDLARPPRDYVKGWVEAGYLRQFYVADDDVPRYELAPSIDKVLDWLHSLRGRGFVGTESRLKTI